MFTLRIVAAGTICDTRTRMQIISDNGQWASTRAVHVVRLISMPHSRTERLDLLYWQRLKSSLYHLNMLLLVLVGFLKKGTPHTNSSCTEMCSKKNSSHSV